jgi:adenosylcobyric acid synthase
MATEKEKKRMTHKAKTLMIQGTGSDVGKSVITAGICRLLHRKGWKVAPFKAQNMSLNSFVTPEGGEISRAQSYQAEACNIAPRVEMNPILIKPIGDNLSQVVLMGKAQGNRVAGDYFERHEKHKQIVKGAFDTLAKDYDLIVIEGAGSPAEINLKQWDLVNMHLAEQVDAPVIIVGDIDRGGVFAWMKGTLDLLEPSEKDRVAGFLINKFRGDIELLNPGLKQFEDLAHKPILGVLPYFRNLVVDEEDSIPQWSHPAQGFSGDPLDIAVLWYPRVANFTDLAPLANDPNVSLRYVAHPSQLGRPDLIILPGSKNTIDDLQYLKDAGMDRAINRCRSQGTTLFGICGGFQMLGRKIRDPQNTESQTKEIDGLNLFDADTTLHPEKVTRQVIRNTIVSPLFKNKLTIRGYEIHTGVTKFSPSAIPLFQPENDEAPCPLGIVSDDCSVIGTYLHGCLDEDSIRNAFLDHLRKRRGLTLPEKAFSYHQFRNDHMDRLADWIENSIDIELIIKIINQA